MPLGVTWVKVKLFGNQSAEVRLVSEQEEMNKRFETHPGCGQVVIHTSSASKSFTIRPNCPIVSGVHNAMGTSCGVDLRALAWASVYSAYPLIASFWCALEI